MHNRLGISLLFGLGLGLGLRLRLGVQVQVQVDGEVAVVREVQDGLCHLHPRRPLSGLGPVLHPRILCPLLLLLYDEAAGVETGPPLLL